MPRLTRITETKRGRYALFLDDAFAFSLDEDTFAAAGLHAGDELTEPAVAELRRKSDARRALDKAMDLLALRDHAAGELYAKLCRRCELGLLDDAGFARRRAAELLRKRKSRREILQDLAAKGIDRETAADALAALMPADGEEDPDLASARALVERQYARKLAEGKTQQVMAALARRGFSHAVIRAAVQPRDPEE